MVPYRFFKKEVGNLISKNVFISLLVKYFNAINNIESLTIFESCKLEIKRIVVILKGHFHSLAHVQARAWAKVSPFLLNRMCHCN